MNEEQKMILEMVRDGVVSVDEAERLLATARRDGAAEETQAVTVVEPNAPVRPIQPKRLHVSCRADGKQTVNVKIPFSLVRAGLKIAQVVGPKYSKEAEMLKDIDLDEVLASLASGEVTLPYTMVEVHDEEGNEDVLVTLE